MVDLQPVLLIELVMIAFANPHMSFFELIEPRVCWNTVDVKQRFKGTAALGTINHLFFLCDFFCKCSKLPWHKSFSFSQDSVDNFTMLIIYCILVSSTSLAHDGIVYGQCKFTIKTYFYKILLKVKLKSSKISPQAKTFIFLIRRPLSISI